MLGELDGPSRSCRLSHAGGLCLSTSGRVGQSGPEVLPRILRLTRGGGKQAASDSFQRSSDPKQPESDGGPCGAANVNESHSAWRGATSSSPLSAAPASDRMVGGHGPGSSGAGVVKREDSSRGPGCRTRYPRPSASRWTHELADSHRAGAGTQTFGVSTSCCAERVGCPSRGQERHIRGCGPRSCGLDENECVPQ